MSHEHALQPAFPSDGLHGGHPIVIEADLEKSRVVREDNILFQTPEGRNVYRGNSIEGRPIEVFSNAIIHSNGNGSTPKESSKSSLAA